jgi:hypothetical protein
VPAGNQSPISRRDRNPRPSTAIASSLRPLDHRQTPPTSGTTGRGKGNGDHIEIWLGPNTWEPLGRCLYWRMANDLSALPQDSKPKDAINVLITYDSDSGAYTCTYCIPRVMTADIRAEFRGCWLPGDGILGIPQKASRTRCGSSRAGCAKGLGGLECSCNYVKAEICTKEQKLT